MIWNSQLSSNHSDVRCRRYTYQLPHQTLGARCLVGVLHSAIGDLIDLRAGESQWFRTGLWQERHYSPSIHSASLILIIFSMLQWVCWAWLYQWHLMNMWNAISECEDVKTLFSCRLDSHFLDCPHRRIDFAAIGGAARWNLNGARSLAILLNMIWWQHATNVMPSVWLFPWYEGLLMPLD